MIFFALNCCVFFLLPKQSKTQNAMCLSMSDLVLHKFVLIFVEDHAVSEAEVLTKNLAADHVASFVFVGALCVMLHCFVHFLFRSCSHLHQQRSNTLLAPLTTEQCTATPI